MADQYRYLFHDLWCDRFIEELPLANVTLERNLASIGPGSFTADLFLGDRRLRMEKNWRDATDARGARVYTELNGDLISCHAVWDTDDDLKTHTRKITGTELWDVYHHRLVSYDRVYVDADQLDIVRDLLRQEHREPNGDFGVIVDPWGTAPLSGRVRHLTTYQGDAGKDLAAAVEEQARVVDGFDFDITVAYDPLKLPVCRFVTGFPRLGVDDSPLVFTWPGNIAEGLHWPRVGSSAVNRVAALGQNRLRQDWIDGESLGCGYPLLEAAVNYHDVKDPAVLLLHAQNDLAALRWPRDVGEAAVTSRPGTPTPWRRSMKPSSVPSIPVRADQVDVREIVARLGDSIAVQIEDDVFFPGPQNSPDGRDRRVFDRFRLVGVKLTPAEQKVELVLNSLDVLDARLRAIA
jgi:hypothetical protein